MTLSGEESADAATLPGPRTTIASFVVHRVRDRWLCASAHHTDVILETDTAVINQASVSGLASHPRDQAS